MSVEIRPQRMNLARWYGNSVRIPDYDHRHYKSFVVNCFGIVNGLVERKMGKRIRIGVMSSGTAAADQDNGLIKINEKFLLGIFNENQKNPLPSDQTISAILGIIVHEAAHFAYSPKTLLTWMDYMRDNAKSKLVEPVAMTLGNITEDIYIEAQVNRVLPNLSWMLEASTRTIFKDDVIQQRIAKVEGITDAPHTMDEVPAILNYLILAKVPGVRPKVSPYLTALFDLTQEAAELDNLQDRLALTLQVYEALMHQVGKRQAPPQKEERNESQADSDGDETQDNESSEAEVGEEQSGEGDAAEADEEETGEAEAGGEDDDGVGETDRGDSAGERSDDGIAIPLDSEEGEDESDEEGEESEDETENGFGSGLGMDGDDENDEWNTSLNDDALDFGDTGDDEEEEMSAEIAEALADALEDAQGLFASHHDSFREFHLNDVPQTQMGAKMREELGRMEKFNMLPHQGIGQDEEQDTIFEQYCEMGSAMEMDKRYVRLAEAGRQRATVNRPYGEDKVRGTNIRRLHRIATDGKIFAERVAMSDYRPMQVAILIDCSASMNSRTYALGIPRIESAVKAALGACYGLMEARCEVAIYGHTADTIAGCETVVYVAKEFHQGMEGLDERINWLWQRAPRASNRDGVAIKHVGAKFTRKDRRRVLIVISDGMPSASGYSGALGIQRTNQDVEGLRKQGIDVLSISITEEAKKPNDQIYGAEHNVYNQDPNVIEKIVQRLIET